MNPTLFGIMRSCHTRTCRLSDSGHQKIPTGGQIPGVGDYLLREPIDDPDLWRRVADYPCAPTRNLAPPQRRHQPD